MSATSTASTTELQEYCLRKLGKPVIDVNLADEQMDDMIAESVQLFQEYHFDGTERAFLVEQVAPSTLTFASSATGTLSQMKQLLLVPQMQQQMDTKDQVQQV